MPGSAPVALTQEVVRELAALSFPDAPIVSCYVDVDGRRHPRRSDYEDAFDTLLRRAREAGKAPAADLQKFAERVKGGVDRSRVRGLALFSCAAKGFWREVEIPVPVRSRIVVNSVPAIAQLESSIENFERFGLLVADRQRARMFVFELGELVEHSERFDALPPADEHGERGVRMKDITSKHQDAATQTHLKQAAHVAFQVFQQHKYDHLVLGVADDLVADLEKELHTYLRDRVVARVSVPVNASADVVKKAALEAEEKVERGKEAAAVAKLRDAVGAKSGGVAGLAGVLEAVSTHRVDLLLVSDGYEAQGWQCTGCGCLAAVGRTCPTCKGTMDAVDDVVEAAVDRVLAEKVRVEVCVGNADLDVLGRIGALLRY